MAKARRPNPRLSSGRSNRAQATGRREPGRPPELALARRPGALTSTHCLVRPAAAGTRRWLPLVPRVRGSPPATESRLVQGRTRPLALARGRRSSFTWCSSPDPLFGRSPPGAPRRPGAAAAAAAPRWNSDAATFHSLPRRRRGGPRLSQSARPGPSRTVRFWNAETQHSILATPLSAR